MIPDISKLSDHFRCLAFSELPIARALEAQEAALRRFGPVITKPLMTWDSMASALLPLRTFPRNFVIAQIGGWSLVMCDMIGEPCLSDVFFHSELFQCRAVGGIAVEKERRFFYIERGRCVRDIECFNEGQWRFRERGAPLAFEQRDRYLLKKRSERLTPDLVLAYIRELTDINLPLNFGSAPGELLTLERSWHELQVTPYEIRVENDLFPITS